MSVVENAGPVSAGLKQGARAPTPAIEPRRAPCRSGGFEILAELERELPQYALHHLDALFSGDPEVAWSLIKLAPDEFRGMVALAAYYLGTPNPGYREILSSVWSHDWRCLQNEVYGDLAFIRRMFRAGKSHVPFSGRLRIYRGAAGVDLRTASQGISWTTSRDVACWFAMRNAFGDRPPIVVTASVDASWISYYSDERSEAEVVLRRRIRAEVDADPASWEAASERNTLRNLDLEAQMLKQLAQKYSLEH